MWYIVRLDSSRVATLVKVRSVTLVSSGNPTRVKSNYIPVYTTILRQIERCHDVQIAGVRPVCNFVESDVIRGDAVGIWPGTVSVGGYL